MEKKLSSEPQSRSSFRYERKFCVENMPIKNLVHYIKIHPFVFSEIFQQRFINNIYLDTPDYSSYTDNLIGVATRTKYRVRWYGNFNGHVKKAHLEIKRKEGLVGDKESYLLNDFNFNKGFNLTDLRVVFENSSLPENIQEKLKSLLPTIINRYSRKYFLSACKAYRATTDSDLEFHVFKTLGNDFFIETKYPDLSILELKYEVDKDLKAHQVTQHIPCRLSKSSKYVLGLSTLISRDQKEQISILNS